MNSAPDMPNPALVERISWCGSGDSHDPILLSNPVQHQGDAEIGLPCLFE